MGEELLCPEEGGEWKERKLVPQKITSKDEKLLDNPGPLSRSWFQPIFTRHVLKFFNLREKTNYT